MACFEFENAKAAVIGNLRVPLKYILVIVGAIFRRWPFPLPSEWFLLNFGVGPPFVPLMGRKVAAGFSVKTRSPGIYGYPKGTTVRGMTPRDHRRHF